MRNVIVQEPPMMSHLRELESVIRNVKPIARIHEDGEDWQIDLQNEILRRAISRMRSVLDVMEARTK